MEGGLLRPAVGFEGLTDVTLHIGRHGTRVIVVFLSRGHRKRNLTERKGAGITNEDLPLEKMQTDGVSQLTESELLAISLQ